jgi:hypothetical protein
MREESALCIARLSFEQLPTMRGAPYVTWGSVPREDLQDYADLNPFLDFAAVSRNLGRDGPRYFR